MLLKYLKPLIYAVEKLFDLYTWYVCGDKNLNYVWTKALYR